MFEFLLKSIRIRNVNKESYNGEQDVQFRGGIELGLKIWFAIKNSNSFNNVDVIVESDIDFAVFLSYVGGNKTGIRSV